MKSNLKLYWLLVIFACGSYSASYSQKEAQDLLRGGIDDAQILAQNYMAPFGKAFGSVLNQGWYNTAKPHSFPFFDLTLFWNWSFVPSADDNFTMSGLKVLRPQNASENITPSIAGESSNGPTMNVMVKNPLSGNDTAIANFKMPPGLNLKAMNLPIAQLTLGLIKNTDVSIRYMPDFNLPGILDAKVHLWGIGLKHDLKQYLPFMSLIPIDISLQGGYTSFKSSLALGLLPDSNAIPSGANYGDQKLEFDVNSWTANLIVSKKLPTMTFYGSIGYQHSTSKFGVLGTFPTTTIQTDASSSNYGKAKVVDIKDPVNLNLSGINGMKGTVGIRFRLIIFTLHADYTIAQYPGVTTGFGVDIDLK